MDRNILDMKTEKNGSELTVRLCGPLNTMTSPMLSKHLEAELPGVQHLALDFADCEFVSSAGLRVLLNVYKSLKAAGGAMVLIHVGDAFREVLEGTGFYTVFDIR